MFKLGASTVTSRDVSRGLNERVAAAGYAAMAYWLYRWDWGESIAMDGLWSAGSVLADSAFSDFAVRETRRWLESEPGGLDPMGPATVALDLLDAGSMPDADAALEKLEELANRVLDSGEVTGGISPHGVDSVVFVDALYGYPSSIVRLGLMTGSDRTVDRICALTARHCELVQSRASGLFSHFSPVRPDAQPLTTAWGRGNGWALLGLSDLLAVLPSSHDRYAELAERLRAGVEGARLHQCPDGSFRNIVDQAASYPESSATAMIEAAVSQGVALGFLDTKLSSMADRAWAAIEHRIDTNGHLVGVSYRPGVNEDLRRYEHTPAIGSYPWGQGAYLRAACARYVRSLNNQETSSTEGAR